MTATENYSTLPAPPGRPLMVLMAEDDEHDIVATRRAWEKHGIVNSLHIVRDGEECLDFLFRRGKYSSPGAAPRIGMLLLDLNMPKLDGVSVLRMIRANESYRHLPVVVLTTSRAAQDRKECYELGANAYIMKPVGFKNYADALRTINSFWQLAELPE